jgi:DNA repair protein RadC
MNMQDDPDRSSVSESAPVYSIPRLDDRSNPFNPVAKARKRGVASLTDTELLALITGTTRRDVCDNFIRTHGLRQLVTVSVKELERTSGLSRGGALRLAAAFEVRRRVREAEGRYRPRLTRPRDVAKEVRDIADLKKEHLVGLYFDAQNGLLYRETVSVGSLNTTRAHPREVFHPALVHLAYGVILAHNHPSGSLDPSDEDIAFSRSIHRAGEMLGIELYDHIIVAPTGFTSLRERGVF